MLEKIKMWLLKGIHLKLEQTVKKTVSRQMKSHAKGNQSKALYFDNQYFLIKWDQILSPLYNLPLVFVQVFHHRK